MKHFVFAASIIWGCEAFLRNSGLKNWNNLSPTPFLDIITWNYSQVIT
jgi:hypothetical protein